MIEVTYKVSLKTPNGTIKFSLKKDQLDYHPTHSRVHLTRSQSNKFRKLWRSDSRTRDKNKYITIDGRFTIITS